MQPIYTSSGALTLQTQRTKISLQHWETPETQSGKKWLEGLPQSATRLTVYLYLWDPHILQQFLKRNAFRRPSHLLQAECLARHPFMRVDIPCLLYTSPSP